MTATEGHFKGSRMSVHEGRAHARPQQGNGARTRIFFFLLILFFFMIILRHDSSESLPLLCPSVTVRYQFVFVLMSPLPPQKTLNKETCLLWTKKKTCVPFSFFRYWKTVLMKV